MITLKTIGAFLLGRRAAIETIANSNKAIFLLALLFIISAGLARNYDHHRLFQEPLWITAPIGMALFSSLFIYGFVKLVGRLSSRFETFANYGAFLRCFLMTAPLAWLYGIPVEELLEALPATIFNFWVLLLVSVWRLLLMARVVQVLFGFSSVRAFALISIPASVEMFVATLVKHVDIVGVMGGMRLSEAKQFLLTATHTMTVGSMVLFFLTVVALPFSSPYGPSPWKPEGAPAKVARQSWITALVIIAMWAAAALVPQQRLADLEKFRDLVAHEQFEEASAFARKIGENGFPPHRQILPGYFTRPATLKPLAYHRDWPDWLQEQLENDLADWLKYRLRSNRSPARERQMYENLFENLQDAPYVQEIADEFAPGVTVRDLFTEENSGLPPTIGENPEIRPE